MESDNMKSLNFNSEIERQLILEKREKDVVENSLPFTFSMLIGLLAMIFSLAFLDSTSEWHLSIMVVIFVSLTALSFTVYSVIFNRKTQQIKAVVINDENYKVATANELNELKELLNKIQLHKEELEENLNFEDNMKKVLEFKLETYSVKSENPQINGVKKAFRSYLDELETKINNSDENSFAITNGIESEYQEIMKVISALENHVANLK